MEPPSVALVTGDHPVCRSAEPTSRSCTSSWVSDVIFPPAATLIVSLRRRSRPSVTCRRSASAACGEAPARAPARGRRRRRRSPRRSRRRAARCSRAPRRPRARLARSHAGGSPFGQRPDVEDAHHHHPEGRDDLQLGAAEGQEDEQRGEHAEEPIQRGSSPTRSALIISSDHARGERQARRAGRRSRRSRWPSPLVSACSTAWLLKSWPTAKLCVSIALTTWWPRLTTRDGDPAVEHERIGGRQVCGRRKRVASSSSSRTSVSAPTAIAASTLPASSAKAWWPMNLTSAARGLTAGSASPRSAGARPCSRPDGGRAFERAGDDDRAQQVEHAAGEGGNREARAALGLALDLLADLACGGHEQGSL